MGTMKNKWSSSLVIFLTTFLLTGWTSDLSAQSTNNNERYKLAVYATGSQNDQQISPSLLSVVQSRTITKLTNEGNYQLIERSNDFLQQILKEQTTQQSGDVADDQIVEIGKGYGAEKICVVSVTIIDKYLYVATRIVDVATKTSYESGDAQVNNYKSIPTLTKTLDESLNKMLSVSSKMNVTPVAPAKPSETPKTTKVSSNEQSQPIAQPKLAETTNLAKVSKEPTQHAKEQKTDKVTSQQSVTSAETYGMVGYEDYVKQLKENSSFLSRNSIAYKEWQKRCTNMILGSIFTPFGVMWVSLGTTYLCMGYGWYWSFFVGIGGALTITGVVLLCTMNSHLKKSYNYYLNGDQKTATLQFYPYYGENKTFGAGLTLRF